MLDLLDVDASSQSTLSPMETEAENELLDLPITVTKKGRSRSVLEHEMVISDREYPCEIIGEKQIRGNTWYLIRWEATLEPQESVSLAAVKAWQEKKDEEESRLRVRQVQTRKKRKQQ